MNLNSAKSKWWWVRTFKWAVKFLKFLLLLGGVILIWAYSFLLVTRACRTPLPKEIAWNSENLLALLFGASSIALFIFSFLASVAGVVGWRSFNEFREKLTSAVEAIRNELKGRVATNLGYVIGEMSLKPGSFDIEDKDRLEQAVGQCREGYKYLQMLGVGSPAETLALNNLLFYTCILHEGDVHRRDEDYMLKEARRLKELGEQHNSSMLKLTAYRVLLAYGASLEEKEKAVKGLRALLANGLKISERELKEANYCLERYSLPPVKQVPQENESQATENQSHK